MPRLIALLLALFLAGCASIGEQAQAGKLSADLQALSPTVNANEAARLARTALEKSAELAREYRPFFAGWLNNNLVNSGVRSRGLCWHWRDDLFPHLHALQLHSLDLHLASARRGTWREHNAIVVTAKGQRFSEGIVLDPWRRGGVLVWQKVAKDRNPWLPLPLALTPDSLRPLFSRVTH